MARNTKSQWDFGELFPPEATRRVLTVSELTSKVRRLLEKEIGSVWVTGEITNLRAQSSGHIYFTLKDSDAQLQCALFRGESVTNRQALQDGQRVVLQGDITVYEPRGQYQMIVRAVELHGVGALQIAFERLKQQLQAEGLFAQERKRPLPKYPQRIGLVTSPTGAAIQDVLHVVGRRQPGLELILAPCRVQGEGAATEIAEAIHQLNLWSQAASPDARLDLILVTRGGGSLEDLWAFNDEGVARAIFESALPVVSAVGHEIDFTISDFVADVRAATPSAAAELITEGAFASRRFVAETREYLHQLAVGRLEQERENVDDLARRLARLHPQRLIEEQWQHLDELAAALLRSARQRLRERQIAWQNLRRRHTQVRPSELVARHHLALGELGRRLYELARHRLQADRSRFGTTEARLRLLSPESVLARGYSITLDAATGAVLRDAAKTRRGHRLKTRLQRGEVRSIVEE